MNPEGIRAYIHSQRILIEKEKSLIRGTKSPPFLSRTEMDGNCTDPEDAVEGYFGGNYSSVNKSADSVSLKSESSDVSITREFDQKKCAILPSKKSPLPLNRTPPSKQHRVLLDNSLSSFKAEKENLTLHLNDNKEREVRCLQEKLSESSFWDNFGDSSLSLPKFENTMVRVGEFSPSNPHLQAPGGALLGLGEYEERRRQLLELKKQEYKDHLSQSRNILHRADHSHASLSKNNDGSHKPSTHQGFMSTLCASNVEKNCSQSDVSTQTDLWLMQPTVTCSDCTSNAIGGNVNGFLSTDGLQISLSPGGGDSSLPALSPREKHTLELQHHHTPCFVPRAHISQTADQLPDARLRQLQLQGELLQQIEDKRRLEAERRERERLEEEALMRRVAEQQARQQAEYEKEEQTRCEREKQKQQQMEEFQRRQEELKVEAEHLRQEKRHRRKPEARAAAGPRPPHDAHPEPAPMSILKTASPPPRSPRPRPAVSLAPSDLPRLPEQLPQPLPPLSPRALIKVLEGPTQPRSSRNLNDSLPIPLMPRSPRRARDRRERSPSRVVPHSHLPASLHPSEAMRNLEDRWKIPAVQRNVCRRGGADVENNNAGNVLTQLGTFRRQLQMEHMRMEEKVRETQRQHYQHEHFQEHPKQRRHRTS